MSAFSDFIRNASEDEKQLIYEEVMKRAAERQSAVLHKTIHVTAKHAIVTDVCRSNRTNEGAVDEALARLREEALRLFSKRGHGRGDKFHFRLDIEREVSRADSRREDG